MTRAASRTAHCSHSETKIRFEQAEAFLAVARMALTADDDETTPGVAAALAVLAGIAASDAVCCAAFGRRSRGSDHRQAITMLESISPAGPTLAKSLQELLAAKDDAHYGATLVSKGKATAMIRRASSIIDVARTVVIG